MPPKQKKMKKQTAKKRRVSNDGDDDGVGSAVVSVQVEEAGANDRQHFLYTSLLQGL